MNTCGTELTYGELAGAEAQRMVELLRWKAGVQLPPFIVTNTAVIKLLHGLLDGTAELPSAVRVTKAVAVQIALLVASDNVMKKMSWLAPSQPSLTHLVASVSLVPALVLSYALPAEIQRRRPPRRGTAAIQAAGARAGGAIWHVFMPRLAEALLPVARVGGRAALCAPLDLPTGQHWHAYQSQRRRSCLWRLVVRQEHCVSVL